MLYNNKSTFSAPTDLDSERSSLEFLPQYFATQANKKILAATLDQLIRPGNVEKINGYFGRRTAKAFDIQDNYIPDLSADRENYQFEPAIVAKDDLNNLDFFAEYRDVVNQIDNLGGNKSNHSKLFAQEYYAWDPHIDWDKFSNYREYYWLPNGPNPVPVRGQTNEVKSTFKVSLQDNLDNVSYVFDSEVPVGNPNLKLYRGQTYKFEIDAPGYPIAFALDRTFKPGEAIVRESVAGVRKPGLFDSKFYDTDTSAYDIGEFEIVPQNSAVTGYTDSENTSTIYSEGISIESENQEAVVYVEKGTIEFTIPANSPDKLFYISKTDINTSGYIQIADIEDNTSIDVDSEIVGRSEYTSANGVTLSNGMAVYFQGEVTPDKFKNREFFVEGVGKSISLVAKDELKIPSQYTDNVMVPFDSQLFDNLPFSDARGYPAEKDYILINRNCADKNHWSRYNRWFHRSVIENAAKVNQTELVFDENARAKRPIIEFEPGLKLYNFGSIAKLDVDLVDNFTTDAFSMIQGKIGYNIDGVDLAEGMRVLFNADADRLVSGKIYKVIFETLDGARRITLREEPDTLPNLNEVVFVTKGEENAGRSFYYDGNNWKLGQQKTKTNQPPRFDLFDDTETSFSDSSKYPANNFRGTTIFEYAQGSGSNDSELGFPIKYRTIANSGDIEFNFSLKTDQFTYEINEQRNNIASKTGFVKKFKKDQSFIYSNGFKKGTLFSNQRVIRQFIATAEQTDFSIDCFRNLSDSSELDVIVYKNNTLLKPDDYNIVRGANTKISLNSGCNENDIVLLKILSDADKNDNGYYEIPFSLERNPLNSELQTFTYGEVNDHVATIVEEIDNFAGEFPGKSNLRDTGDITALGKRFLKHSSPFNLAGFFFTNPQANVVDAVRYAGQQYGKFKREFLQKAKQLGANSDIISTVDEIINIINSGKSTDMPFFMSDMVPLSGQELRLSYEVFNGDSGIYEISQDFSLDSVSKRAVLIYINNEQLTHGVDYEFIEGSFVRIDRTIQVGDRVNIVEYPNTNGSFIPPTPSKLGLYPAYRPQKYRDTSYINPVDVIQGHDGSITVAFNDYRDDLLLELELRIYNNIKNQYTGQDLNIQDLKPGEYRKNGVSRDDFNRPLISDFYKWLTLAGSPDYNTNSQYDINNAFTYNFKGSASPSGTPVQGYYRALYNFAFDTDTPHLTPWRMIGFANKPSWWESVYGPEPYTKNNLILWRDLEQGKIVQPNRTPIFDSRYVRPGLPSYVPVDESGNLINPYQSGYATGFVESNARLGFVFGDENQIETAWRRSEDYPFAFLISWLLNKPADLFSKGFDKNRQTRDLSGNIQYNNNTNPIELDKIVFPDIETSCQGLVNYITDYVNFRYDTNISNLQNTLAKINNQISLKVGGFTDKTKFKLILDSRTPLNQGNVFVPEENYDVFLNVSKPIELVSYSGVLIEKLREGFRISGYDFSNPIFKFNQPIAQSQDYIINVGGTSVSFRQWTVGNFFGKGDIVQYQENFYRCIQNHTAEINFDDTKFEVLQSLPIEGGRSASIRQIFESAVSEITYGTVLETVEQVSDFLQGYAKYLDNQGFKFENFNKDQEIVEDWRTALREFLFFTTQNWSPGTVLTLSPGASQLIFNSEFAVVDSIDNPFYEYSLRKADGQNLRPDFKNIARENTQFTLSPVNTSDGVYHVKLPLVQKEHIILLDNKTIFDDVIYDKEPGYRQERIKVLGYRSSGWQGGFEIPGFVYDTAEVTDWMPYKDYVIGDLVKYKEFFYAANRTASGKESFDRNDWTQLNERPEPKLQSNFDYRISQFKDFYDLDTDNFDIEQQKFAQHLIGYQNRNYLRNIINDDVSQYKFYQGFIQDKGTRNSVDKLFDVLSAADKPSLDFYEEWALRTGVYGAVENYAELEIVIPENTLRSSPQPIKIVESKTADDVTDPTYKVLPSQIYFNDSDRDVEVLPKLEGDYYKLNTAGYVIDADVEYRVLNREDILDIDINNIKNNDKIWIINDKKNTWAILEVIRSDFKILSTSLADNGNVIFVCDSNVSLSIDDIVGVQNLSGGNGFFRVVSSKLNEIECEVGNVPVEEIETAEGILVFLRNLRTENPAGINNILTKKNISGTRIWVDEAEQGKWQVLENSPQFGLQQSIFNQNQFDSNVDGFGEEISVDKNNTYLVTSTPENESGNVSIYFRGSDNANLKLTQNINFPSILVENEQDAQSFGRAVSLSEDANFLAIGSPLASNVKSNFRGQYQETSNYSKNEIVLKSQQFWQAVKDIKGGGSQTPFQTFADNETFYPADISGVPENLILTGFPGFATEVDHVLLRADVEKYVGSKIGDRLVLDYKTYRYDRNGDLVFGQPFDNQIDNLNEDDFSGTKEILQKVDAIIRVDSFVILPLLESTVFTDSASAKVIDIINNGISVVMYLADIQGVFSPNGEIFTNNNASIGIYSQLFQSDDLRFEGFWKIATSTYTTTEVFEDTGDGLVFVDYLKAEETRNPDIYLNILDQAYDNRNLPEASNRVSYVNVLSYNGNPQDQSVFADQLDNRYVVRFPKTFTDTVNVGDTPQLFFSDRNFLASENTLADYGLSEQIFENNEIQDKWDGYIDYVVDEFSNIGEPFEPIVGDIIQDIQIPFEIDGSISLTQFSNTSKAEVVYYVKQGVSARVYLKITEGNWQKIDNFARLRLERLINEPERGPNDVNRIIGTVQNYENDVALGNAENNVGKLLVFQHNSALPIPAFNDLTEVEYGVFKQKTINGVEIPASVPSSSNLDWTQVKKITASQQGTSSGLQNQGLLSIYQKNEFNEYNLVHHIISPEQSSQEQFGKKIKIVKNNENYTMFVATTNEGPSGRIYILSKTATQDWDFAKADNFRGEFLQDETYLQGSIVSFDGDLYLANTNVQNSQFDLAQWSKIESAVDVNGYFPLTKEIAYGDVDIYDPLTSITRFAIDFDTDQKGNLVAVTAEEAGSDSNFIRKVLIYKLMPQGQYILDQTIVSPNADSGFGDSIKVSETGRKLIVGEPYKDGMLTNEGSAYVYEAIEGKFNLSSEIKGPVKESAESFGINVGFMNDTDVVISSLQGDQIETTIFDNYALRIENSASIFNSAYVLDQDSVLRPSNTTFDNGFTKFSNKSVDVGAIDIFEKINDDYVFAESIETNLDSYDFFGRHFVANNNHIYAGLPKFKNSDVSQGKLQDYRKVKNSTAWSVYRTVKETVDIDKIKTAFLYDKKTQEIKTYLDVIDPLQNRFAGIVEQEVDYKLLYDPAMYNVGPQTGIVDQTNFWAETYTGKVWLDLSSASYRDTYQEDLNYQTNNWSRVIPGTSVRIFEWVESNVPPAEWDSISGTDDALARGISGTSRYGNSIYSVQKHYDSVTRTFSTKYYFWVEGKTTVPAMPNRRVDISTLSDTASFPFQSGIRFAALIGPSEFALYNCESFINGEDTVLHISYFTGDNRNENIHFDYQIISKDKADSKPQLAIEQKWIDSLIGYDKNSRPVPDPNLSEKEKYGTLETPRQSWFVNNREALKQTIQRINYVLQDKLIDSSYDLSSLQDSDQPPSLVSNKIDQVIDFETELQFIGTQKIQQAELSVTVDKGKLAQVAILNPGRGYLTTPIVEVNGIGNNGKIELETNSVGAVTGATIIDSGFGYNENTTLTVRKFSVLVNQDSTIGDRWAIYTWNSDQSEWQRSQSQSYDVRRYWENTDWYKDSQARIRLPAHTIKNLYQIQSLNTNLNDIVRLEDSLTGEWTLYRKFSDADSNSVYNDYEIVGKKDGTIQFKRSLYDFVGSSIGFDNFTYDNKIYDTQPIIETRKILASIKNDIFINDLEIEYNKLFFASLKYVFSEQANVDWAFKTSFVNVKHNVGGLDQKVTFKNDSLPSYEEYLQEVKPYKSNIRQFISAYNDTNNVPLNVSDFDLPPSFNPATALIEPAITQISNAGPSVSNVSIPVGLREIWQQNAGMSIKEIKVIDRGLGYTERPVIRIDGNGADAEAVATLSGGEVSNISLVNSGGNYITTPTVSILGSISEGGRPAKAVAILEPSPVRQTKTNLKFDRTSGFYTVRETARFESFLGTGNKISYNLGWPANLLKSEINVTVDGAKILNNEYTIENVSRIQDGLELTFGKITFSTPPALDKIINVDYRIDDSVLSAEDRIYNSYQSTEGNAGKNLSLLLDGLDYGGVQVNSIDFSTSVGWDADEWFASNWDEVDTSFEDEIFQLDGSTTIIELAQTLEDTVVYNLYRNGKRIDDPEFPRNFNISVTNNGQSAFVINGQDRNGVVSGQNASLSFRNGDKITFTIDAVGHPFILKDVPGAGTSNALNIPNNGIETGTIVWEVGDTGAFYYNCQFHSAMAGEISIAETGDIANPNAETASIIGDGQTDLINLLELGISFADGDVIALRKITSDGSITPKAKDIDTSIEGGNLDYGNAKGVLAEEITIDGDGFVTQTSSKGTEEQVPGQVLDTLDIRVTHRDNDGPGQIFQFNSFVNDKNLIINIPFEVPNSNQIFVQSEGEFLTKDVDYTVNILESTVEIISTGEYKNVTLRAFGRNGENILEMEKIIADGSTQAYSTSTQFADVQDFYVTVNGAPSNALITDNDGVAQIEFSEPLQAGDVASYGLFYTSNKSFSEFTVEEFVHDGSTREYNLQNSPLFAEPARYNTIVESDGKILNAGYNVKYTVPENRQRAYAIQDWQITGGTINAGNVEVYLNGSRINITESWRLDIFNSDVILLTDVGEPGDIVDIYVTDTADYVIENNSVNFLIDIEENTTVKIYQFSNHDILGIDRFTYDTVARAVLQQNSKDYYEYNLLENGIIKLRRPVLDERFIWITVDGALLKPGDDYVTNGNFVNLNYNATGESTIEIIHFANSEYRKGFKFRQFKDILNRTHYKKIDDSRTAIITKPVNYYDLTIEVDNASALSDPNRQTNQPGIIFVNGERIEYMIKTGNTLRQLRRGTMGTAVNELIPAGTEVVDQARDLTIPYADRNLVNEFTAESDQRLFDINFSVNSVNDIEVFVGGRRLRKSEIDVYNAYVAQTSPQGDQTVQSDFTITGNTVRLTDVANAGEKVIVVKKQGLLWSEPGKDLANSDTDIANFIKS